MTTRGSRRDRVRARAVRLAGRLPRDVGPPFVQRLGREDRAKRAQRLMASDPESALRLLTAEITPDAPAWLVHSASLAAIRSEDFAAAVELITRLGTITDLGFADCVRLVTATRQVGTDEDLLRAQRSMLTAPPPASTPSLNHGVRALHGLEASLLPEVESWRARLAAHGTDLDLSAPDRLILELRAREMLVKGPIDPDTVVDLLTHEAGAPMLLREILRAKRFRELEELIDLMPPESLARVGDGLWELIWNRARSFGWTSLAATAISQIEGTVDEAVRAQRVAEAADEQALLASPWHPPTTTGPTEPASLDPRSVVSVLGQSLPLRSGGYATRSHGILTGLAARGWDMTAVTRRGFPFDMWWSEDDARVPAPVDVVDGIPYHRLLDEGVRHYPRAPLPPYVDECAKGVAEIARRKQASLIHASSLYDVGMAGLVAARELSVPFVYEMRGLKQLLEAARQPLFVESPRHTYLDQLEGTVARNADALLVITEALGRKMVQMGVDPDRITVVPNGVDASRFTPRPRNDDLARELGLSGKTVIGYVGGLVHYEGLELLVEAATQMRTRRQDFHVLVVGDGAHQRALHEFVDENDAGDLVTFTGRVSHDEVEEYLSLVDIAPFPRRPLPVCELISPIKPFEAMAMRKAVVASDVAALAEIVQDGVTGRLFAKGDASDLARVLEELIDSPTERERLGDAAREWVVAERDWHRITGVVDGVYRDLLGARTSS